MEVREVHHPRNYKIYHTLVRRRDDNIHSLWDSLCLDVLPLKKKLILQQILLNKNFILQEHIRKASAWIYYSVKK